MANEANTIAAWDSPEGLVHQLLYQFPIEAPFQVNNGNAVPTPASSLPQAALQIAHTRGLIEALDDGRSGFAISSVTRYPQDTESDFHSRLRRDYEARRAAFFRDYQADWSPKQPTPALPTRSCLICEGSLEGLRPLAEYCSNACRQWAYRERQRVA